MPVYDLYSTRDKRIPDVFTYEEIPLDLRVQIIHILADMIPDVTTQGPRLRPLREYVSGRVVAVLRREHCLLILNDGADEGPWEELTYYVIDPKTSTKRVLDVLEVAVQVRAAVKAWSGKDSLVEPIEELNLRFRFHGVGYQLVGTKILRMDSNLLHAEAVLPALRLLSDSAYAGPNQEYLQAADYHRAGGIEEKSCLVWCGKAFESTMKVICEKRGWPYERDKAGAKDLVSAILENGLVPKHHTAMLTHLRGLLETAIPTPRNRHGGHGQGAEVTEVSAFVAGYVLHMTAATIVMLIEAEKALG